MVTFVRSSMSLDVKPRRYIWLMIRMSKPMLCLALLTPLAGGAQTVADLQCKATGKDLIFDCVIRLARTNEPVSGAKLSVAADMPSIPGEHRLPPVTPSLVAVLASTYFGSTSTCRVNGISGSA